MCAGVDVVSARAACALSTVKFVRMKRKRLPLPLTRIKARCGFGNTWNQGGGGKGDNINTQIMKQ